MTAKKVNATGIVTYWNTSVSNVVKLRNACVAIDPELDKWLPNETTPLAALHHALRSVYGEGYLVRRLRGNGFVVVKEDKGRNVNDYEVVARAVFDDADIVRVECDDDREKDIHRAYKGHREIIEPGGVGCCLGRILVGYLGGTSLRPRTGGVYWLSAEKADIWDKISRAAEAASLHGNTTIHTLRNVMDASAIKAVRDAIVAEANAAAEVLTEEINSGRHGPKRLRTKERDAVAMIEKVERYEAMLDVALGDVRKTLDGVKDAAAAAAVLASVEVEEAA